MLDHFGTNVPAKLLVLHNSPTYIPLIYVPAGFAKDQ